MNWKETIYQDRYKEIKGYKFDKWIFQLGLVLIIGWLFLVAYHYDFQMNYYNCMDQQCENPFYKPADWINQQYLTTGEYGMKIDWYYKSVYFVSFGGLMFLFLLNHLIYNKGKGHIKKLQNHFESCGEGKNEKKY